MNDENASQFDRSLFRSIKVDSIKDKSKIVTIAYFKCIQNI